MEDQIEAEASRWFARQRMPGLSRREEAELEAWLRADPRHAAALDGMSRVFDQIASLKSLAALEPLEPAGRRLPSFRTPRAGYALAGLSAAAAVLLAVVVAPGALGRAGVDQSTGTGEIRVITLGDGSRVTLGAKSKIRVAMGEDARRVTLTEGEAFFEVAHDTARPFYVETGPSVVRVVGTKFDVRRAFDHVDVAVLEGVVEVRERALLPGAAETRVLRAGQRVRAEQGEFASLRAPVGQVGAVAPTVSAAGAWREGQLTYDNTRLDDMVGDLNRYYAPGVRLEAGALRGARVAASFKVHELERFLQELSNVVPVDVRKEADGAIVIRSARRTPDKKNPLPPL